MAIAVGSTATRLDPTYQTRAAGIAPPLRQHRPALRDYAEAPAIKTANGTRTADFADALIVRRAAATMRLLGQRNGMTYTFDRPAQQLPGTQAL